MPRKGFTLGSHAAPARLAAAVTILSGVADLSGWAFHIPSLTSVLPDGGAMQPNTAVALILSGTSLLILAGRISVKLERLAHALALLVVAIGLVSLGEYVFAWQPGIDQLLGGDIDVPT